jgi:hypothetical protein
MSVSELKFSEFGIFRPIFGIPGINLFPSIHEITFLKTLSPT